MSTSAKKPTAEKQPDKPTDLPDPNDPELIEQFWSNSLTTNSPDSDVLAESGESGDLGEVPVKLKTETKYTTAQTVSHPRNNNRIALRLKDEARRSGESFFYGWGNGKDRVLGPSIKLAQAAVRCYGNAAIEMGDVQDLKDSWIFTAYFIDLETGFTYGRQFRQSKNWTIHGRFDQERKDDMRFQIGQSKAIRNVIINCIPEWIINGAIKEAQSGVREKVMNFINAKGIAAAQTMIVTQLARHGVTENDICSKMEVINVQNLDAEMIVMLRGDLYALDNGMDHANQLFATLGKDGKDKSGSKSAADSAFDPSTSQEDPDVNQDVVNQSSSPPAPKKT